MVNPLPAAVLAGALSQAAQQDRRVKPWAASFVLPRV